jgi:hypothetical protein
MEANGLSLQRGTHEDPLRVSAVNGFAVVQVLSWCFRPSERNHFS